MDELIAQFTTITGATVRNAETYLKVSDGDLPQAIQLYFDTGGADMESGPSTQKALRASEPTTAASGSGSGSGVNSAYDEDEAIARRLQEEFYGGAGGAGSGGENGVRAPIARTRDTLIGGGDDYGYAETMAARRMRAAIASSRRERSTPNVWASEGADHSGLLSGFAGGASESSSRPSKLAEIFRPPFEIMTNLSFQDARDEAKEVEKWILVNIQDNSLFACQALNRDIWKAAEVKATVKENFVFLQMDRAGRDGKDYLRLYMANAVDDVALFASGTKAEDVFPHIAIIDPRTGEQVKVWTDVPKKPLEFVMVLHEFLDRYSLKVDAKNPVQRKTKPKSSVAHMTEDEMMQLAMQNSLGSTSTPPGATSDPDDLTKTGGPSSDAGDLMEFEDAPEHQADTSEKQESVFWRIRGDNHHAEPLNGPDVTRIQFKMSDGSRVVRKFLLKDRVERLFEYVKADLLPEHQEKRKSAADDKEDSLVGKEFELVSLGKKLIDHLEETIDEAGLKMGTVMVEIVD
ncbi:thioredoxin-like protein [Tuber borchii]|uniref:Thioredoxin-like protein n=1 Tax=Tuber borchii TaxID=42251 RepID=A0A2T6ZJZ2_TUBBO|nr:thioredoxin-like protein [Tuber borchii]